MTNEKEQIFTAKIIVPFSIGLLLTLAALAIALNSDWRESVRQSWFQPYRKILRIAKGDILNEGTSQQILKIKTNEGLFIEVYGAFNNHTRPLVDRIRLPDSRDGFFHFRGEATNLALDDIDGDGTLEIIAPTFDEGLNGHLNVLSYNTESKKFETFTQ